MSTTLARVVETCIGCPAQWDAWTVDGQYLYLRYRFGIGTVEHEPGIGPHIQFGEASYDGTIDLSEFLAQAGLTLAPDADVIPYSQRNATAPRHAVRPPT